jgi:hypothetical protein
VELKLLDKRLHDFRRDVLQLQIFFDGNRQSPQITKITQISKNLKK